MTERRSWVPRTCVWELTLACNCRCVHCGSDAGAPRPRELDTSEGLALIGELAALGCESVTLSGGEPLCRGDWLVLGRAIRRAGMRLEMITNGLSVETEADLIAELGFHAVTFSVDGPAEVHDALRGVPGALGRLLAGAEALGRRGVRVGAVTQVNRANLAALAAIHELLVAHGFAGWQVQLTMPHGRASRDLCLLPAALPRLEEEFVRLRTSSPLFMQAADNFGYMSPHEPLLRTGSGLPTQFWSGCGAGLEVVGVTSDGTVRGCLSLPPAADEGNVRERNLAAIWQDPEAFAYNRRFRSDALGGPCAGCAFARLCRGGCRSLAWATSPGTPFANSFCSFHVASSRA